MLQDRVRIERRLSVVVASIRKKSNASWAKLVALRACANGGAKTAQTQPTPKPSPSAIAGTKSSQRSSAPRRRRRRRDRLGQEYATAQNLPRGRPGRGRPHCRYAAAPRRCAFHRPAYRRGTPRLLRPRCGLQNPLPRSDRTRDLHQGHDRRHPAGRDPRRSRPTRVRHHYCR